MIWVVIGLLTFAAVLSVLWPLTGSAPNLDEDGADVAFYRDRIAEIDAEQSRGHVDRAEAEAEKSRAARSLLASAAKEAAAGDAPVARKIAILLVAFGLPAIALGLYARIGRPDLSDKPAQARHEAAPPPPGPASPVAEMEAYLATHPKDGRTLELMVPTYLQMGRYDEAVKAARAALNILGESPVRLVTYAEALSYANDGVVSPEAEDKLERALVLDPKNLQARYYTALAAAQNDDVAKARDIWTSMLPEMPDGSTAKKDVLDKLAMLDAPPEGGASQGDARALAGESADEQQKTIRAMIDKLAQRLSAQGGGAEEWMRLIRSYKVLNEPDKAQDAFDRAHSALSGDPAALNKLAALAKELGLKAP